MAGKTIRCKKCANKGKCTCKKVCKCKCKGCEFCKKKRNPELHENVNNEYFL